MNMPVLIGGAAALVVASTYLSVAAMFNFKHIRVVDDLFCLMFVGGILAVTYALLSPHG